MGKNFLHKFIINRYGVNFYADSDNIDSDCDELMIFNNGTAQVKVYTNKTPGYQIVQPSTGISFSNEQGGLEKSSFKIQFVGAGTKDVLFQRGIYSYCD